MAASVTDVSLVRLKINEQNDERFVDAQIEDIIEQFPVRDKGGLLPEDEDWQPTYDLNRAASELWLMKAGLFSQDYDFQADGASYTRSQMYEQALKQARIYAGRSQAETIKLISDKQ